MTIPRESLDLVEERKNALKRFMPEVFTEDKLDLKKLNEAFGELIETSGERYSFMWAGKIQSIRIRDKRSKATLIPAKKESVNFDETKNIFIEGDNLEVLKILQKAYEGKVKMIYIDPPYNTGNESIYKDDFTDSLKNYLRYTGQISGSGEKLTTNTETSGRYHSNWLSMMYPRLFLARNILSEDGVIFVSIDDHEIHNLRIIMNDIFGEENFVCQFIWKSRQNVDSRTLTGVSTDHEYVLCYRKSNENRLRGKEIDKSKYSNPDNDPRGPWMSSPLDGIATKDKRPNLHYTIINPKTGAKYNPSPANGWRFQKSTMKQLIAEGRILWPKNRASKPRFKRYLDELQNEFTGFSSVLETVYTTQGTRELRELMGAETLKFPKPVDLIRTIITQVNLDNGVVLDFFAGSGTTAHAILAQNIQDGGNRKFILVQLPEPTTEDSEARKAGYETIAEICKERVRRAIKKLKDEQKQQKLGEKQKFDLGFKVFKLSKSNCFVWDSEYAKDQNTLVKYIEESAEGASKAEPEALVFEIMLREGFKLDSEIQQINQGKNSFFKVTDGEHSLWMCFDAEIDDKSVKKLSLTKDDKLIVLDSSLSDTQKVNLARKSRVETI